MKLNSSFILLICSLLGASSCKKWLDAKPNQQLAIPSTMQDCQALLANSNTMNSTYSFLPELTSDNYYLTLSRYTNLQLQEKAHYNWQQNADVSYNHWQNVYARILNANQVIEILDDIIPGTGEKATWNTLKGSALFFRGFSLLCAADIWAKAYDSTTAVKDMGVPIRLSSDLNEVTERGTVQQTYDRIIQDLKDAVELLPADLPESAISKCTMLTKSTAYAALARLYLSMGAYGDALENANTVLQQYSALMDYNNLDPTAANPIENLNEEVIFLAQSGFSVALLRGLTDSVLMNTYNPDDLRRSIFYRDNADNTYTFKGGYNGQPAYLLFEGLATDEMYLIKAECLARAGNTADAMTTLNQLLMKRWRTGTFTPLTAGNAQAALDIILQERRKELVFRGLRWSDLRRLNKDPRYAITLQRDLDNQIYELPPNDLRYVFLIPSEVLTRVNIPQNPR